MDSEEYRQPSKSALKRAAKEIEEMAGQLAEAADGVVAGLELSEEVREEIELARHTTGRGARKRQVKHLAGLLRHRPEEAAAIQEHLLGQSECHWEQQRVFHQLEEWRDRLCDPDQATATLAELGNRSPDWTSKNWRGFRGPPARATRLRRGRSSAVCGKSRTHWPEQREGTP